MSYSPNTRILVTGATGLLGSELTHQLVAEGHRVRIFRRASSSLKLLGETSDAVEHAVGDLLKPQSLQEAMNDVSYVYHAAATIPSSVADTHRMHRTNVKGTANVVNAALVTGIERLVHVSSIAAIGNPADDRPADEKTPWRANQNGSAYATSKRKAELEVFRGLAEGLEAVIVNPALMFGVGFPEENTLRIVNFVRRGWGIAAPPGSTCVVDVRDVAEGMQRAMRLGDSGERYILAGENLSWKKLLQTLADAFDARPPRYTLPAWIFSGAALLSEAGAWLTRTSPLLPSSIAVSAIRDRAYSNEKAVLELGCTFRAFSDTAGHIRKVLESREGDLVPN